MSGDSAEAYQYLMGMRPSSKSAQEMQLIAEQPRPTTVTGAKYEGLPQYQFNTRTREMTRADKPEDAAAAAPVPRGYSVGLMDMDQGAPGMAKGGRLLSGPGDGVSDSIPAHIDGKTPARLATGEFVFDARTVSEIGNGDRIIHAQELIPDEKTQGQTKITFKSRFTPEGTEQTFGPYTLTPQTDVRFTGRQVSVLDVLRSSQFLGHGVLDLCEQLASDEIASDDAIIEVRDDKVAELAEVVIGWLSANATFKRWGVDAIEHELYTTQPE
jgi:hypothetical protein